MAIRLGAARVGSYQSPGVSLKARQAESKHHWMVLVGLLVFMPLTGLIAFAAMIPKLQTTPLTVDIPAAYLPGNVLPALPPSAACSEMERDPVSCQVNVSGHELFLSFHLATGEILGAAVSAQQFTIGDLIAAWGTPTGIIPYNPYHPIIEIFWDKRCAILASNSLQPNAQVSMILYGSPWRTTFPWRGFTKYSDEVQR